MIDPQWSPDATRIAFWGWGTVTGGKGVFCKGLDDTDPNQLASEPCSGVYLHPYSWSEGLLACTARDPNTREDIWIVYTDVKREPEPILNTNDREYNPAFSPDGRLLAYALEKESGQPHIYVREYSGAEEGFPVSAPGATNPVWSRDGQELYYISADRWMMAVKVTLETELKRGTPYRLFKLPDGIKSDTTWLVRNYDVSKDGRFLMLKQGDVTEHQLIVVQNWFEELSRLSPPGQDK